MWQGFTGWHALIILVVILLLFGAPKLPALARSLGQSMKILKNEVRPDAGKADADDDADRTAASGKTGTTVASEEKPKSVGTTDPGSSA
ncbi:twin-arginine translocase TatA/TatE family subunit [Agromyces sp. CFH 90414]|uniref:Sec-independent protein translocase protein TatA n=1 Tax=Agromyces agglutinans TaxID=2662258 RepID=A0A6I2F1S0_9MICO|nr:twin-arginine translocase TatA/TatE family subunit [Agromyces agglutinans]MRG58422.1 twin-arginine translocase TatA/TatE family subunit [Agromyces agglutinans]